ncbi:AAA family ATPase [Ralstonia solanacearum]|uniref:AAA family ATPase n=1 Tax=Ralstonia solanacearum TaxID=305 RepID=UPI00168B5B6F|nr:AAA family ATPase [Ralstonia solanacearum]QNT25535.1 AAA family ATPase [Ralstonia solanacearum]QNT63176.1 AAA family ATPase [Ralstonia solanacearum]
MKSNAMRTTSAHDVIEQFRAAIVAAGVTPPDHIEADGSLHRFSTTGRAGDKAGYYALHLDDSPAGFFGCWRAGIQQNWKSGTAQDFTPKDRAQLRAARAARDAEQQFRWMGRAGIAAAVWELADPVDPSHPYLARKGITNAAGVKQVTIERAGWFDDPDQSGVLKNCLLVPVRDVSGEMQSLEAIMPNGDKFFLKGARKGGGMLVLPGTDKTIFVCEGYATGASVSAATNATTVIAFDAGNLGRVAKALRDKYPYSRLVVAADNDHASAENRGLIAARDVAAELGIDVAAPSFEPGESGKDWNDFAATHGIAAVRDALRTHMAAANDNEPPTSNRFAFLNVGAMVEHLKPIDWLVRGYVERDSMAVIYGEPGHGKSFVAIDVACSVATGTEWHGRPVKRGAVFYIAGEGHNGLARRFRAWSEARGVSLADAPLYVSNRSAALTEGASAKTVSATVRELAAATGATPSLIVVDTLARNFGAGDENSAADMGAFVTNLDNELRHPWKATVAIVHHSGKDTSKGARGSTALRGAVDSEYEVTKDENGTIRMQPHKMKDAENPEPLSFRLHSVELPLLDEDGNRVFGAALGSCEYVPPSRKGKSGLGKNQTIALQALRDMEADHRRRLEGGGHDPDGALVKEDDWRAKLCADHDFNRFKFRDTKVSLSDNKLIEIVPGGYVRSA